MYLKENEIGQEHALFYIAYATFLELKGNYASADKVYQQGINRLAAPMDRLRSKFSDFQHRMARRIQRKAQEQARGGTSREQEPSHPERQSLSLIRGRPALGVGSQQEKRKATVTPGKANAPAGELTIFVDEEFGGSSNTESTQRGASSKWQSLPTFDQVRKENVQKATMWTGQRIKQKQAHIAAPAPVLDIPVDEEFAMVPMPSNRSDDTNANQSLRQRLEKGISTSTIDETLAHDPLRLHRALPSQYTGMVVKHKVEALAFPAPVAEESEDREELSYEEARALRWHQATAHEDLNDANDFKGAPTQQAEHLSIEHMPMQDAGASGDITITTKGAFDCMNAIFSSRYGGDVTLQVGVAELKDEGGYRGEPRATEPSAAEDVTITTRAAFEALNVAFGGHQGTQAAEEAPQACSDSLSEELPMQKDHPALLLPATDNVFVREDTVFIGNEVPKRSNSVASDSTLNLNDNGDNNNHDDEGGFMIREDTVFINYNKAEQNPDIDPEKGGQSFCSERKPGNLNVSRSSEDLENFPVLTLSDPKASHVLDGDVTVVLQRDSSKALLHEKDQRGLDDTTIVLNRDMPWKATATAECGKEGLSKGLSDEMKSMHIALPSQTAPALRTTIDEEQESLTAIACLRDIPDSNENEPPNDDTTFICNNQNRRRGNAHAFKGLEPLSEIRDAEALLERGIVMEPNPSAEEALAASGQPSCEKSNEEGFAVFEDCQNTERENIPEAIDPFEPAFHGHMLSMLDPPVHRWPEVEPLTEEDQDLVRKIFSIAKKPTANGIPLSELELKNPESIKQASLVHLQLARQSYLVRRGSLGSGAYATVFAARQMTDSQDDVELVALKVEEPACPWELYICKVIAGRVDDSSMFIRPLALMLGSHIGVLQMPLGLHGSLQDLLNSHLKQFGAPLDETLAARVGCQLMRAMGQLHGKARVLHNDIKPDNVLIRVLNEQCEDGERSSIIDVQLIDFGRSVDLELIPSNCVMVGDSGTEAFRCVEMLEERPWLWQADAYGVAGCLHCMLFGDYLQVERIVDVRKDKVERLRIKTAFPRYWQGELWDKVFSTLLNLPCPLDQNVAPPWDELANGLDSWLQGSKDARQRERAAMQRCLECLSRSKS